MSTERVYLRKDTFDLVTFDWNGETFEDPEWERTSRGEVEQLRGQVLAN
jgi:hypothetical protein